MLSSFVRHVRDGLAAPAARRLDPISYSFLVCFTLLQSLLNGVLAAQ